MSKENNKIDVDKVDLDRERDKVSENPGLIAFPHTVGGALIKPEDTGKLKGRAVSAMHQQSQEQLNQLYEQMQLLVRKANEVKHRVEVSERIYTSQMNFEPIIGQVYFLYEKKDGGGDVLSMISPDEWNGRIPYKRYIAQATLLSDHTWKVVYYNDKDQK